MLGQVGLKLTLDFFDIEAGKVASERGMTAFRKAALTK